MQTFKVQNNMQRTGLLTIVSGTEAASKASFRPSSSSPRRLWSAHIRSKRFQPFRENLIRFR